MSKLSKLASAMPFAHFLGRSKTPAAAKAADDERDQREDESDEDYAKRMSDLDDKEEAARKAAEEKEKEEARKAAEEKEKEEARAARRAKRADDGDDDDADMEDDDDDEEASARAGRSKAARQRERVRCARIVAAGINLGRVNQACAFAFDTQLSSAQAIAALDAATLDAPMRRSGLGERMSTVVVANPGTNTAEAAQPKNPAAAAAARIVAAGERAHGGERARGK